jgi:transcriptional regulator GlxA family with amidase domain
MVFCSLDGKAIKAMEGFSVNVDMSLKDLDKEQIRSFIVPGGNISAIDNTDVKIYLQDLKERDVLIAGICAGVDVLDHAGILHDVKSTHSTNEDLVCDKKHYNGKSKCICRFCY